MNPSYPISKKDKKILSGDLTSKFVNEEDAYEAVVELARSAQRCTISIQRPPFDYTKGEEYSPKSLILEKEDITENEIDARGVLIKSREVKIVAHFPDDGLILINPTDRTWEKLNESKESKSAILAFGRRLEAGSRSPLLTSGWGAAYLFLPFSLGLPILATDSLLAYTLNPNIREHYRTTGETSSFHYINEEALRWITIYPWPIFALLALFILLLRLLGGGLQVWPNSFNSISVHYFIHFLWKRIIPEDIKLIRTTIITVTVTAFVTYIITR